jgi:hypothetical protein
VSKMSVIRVSREMRLYVGVARRKLMLSYGANPQQQIERKVSC